jgi:hypothetical protein
MASYYFGLSTFYDIKKLQSLMASSESVKDLFKYWALKDHKLVPLYMMSCKWFTALCFEGNPMTGPMIIGNTKSFYDQIKITDRLTFCEGSNKKLPVLPDSLEYFMIWHLLVPWVLD